jgi:hypothetical protein
MQSTFSEEFLQMNARPQIREILIGEKMRRWSLIARHPFVDSSCSPARARRNFWRLYARYPEIARRLGLNAASLY